MRYLSSPGTASQAGACGGQALERVQRQDPAPRRLLAVLGAAAQADPVRTLWRRAALRIDSGAGAALTRHMRAGEGVYLGRLGLVRLKADPDQARALRSIARLVLPERRVHGRALAGIAPAPLGRVAFADCDAWTWGLKATGVHRAVASGAGVRVAILDTGIDRAHPDFRDRPVTAHSFLEQGDASDDNGHGTLCAGIACGPRVPRTGPRYGIACEAELYVAKVLDRVADGADGAVIAAIEWALAHGCAVASLSVGAVCSADESHAALYEMVAARALKAGLLLVAPAGNHSQRPDRVAPLDSPANCPSVVAVGAVGPDLAVANFSNAGPGLDLVAPGVAVHACTRTPECYARGGGTSVAAPFVAGIAALLAQADPATRGAHLRSQLKQLARPIPGKPQDVGAGLVSLGA